MTGPENPKPIKPVASSIAQAMALVSQLRPEIRRQVYEQKIKPNLSVEGQRLVEQFAMGKAAAQNADAARIAAAGYDAARNHPTVQPDINPI